VQVVRIYLPLKSLYEYPMGKHMVERFACTLVAGWWARQTAFIWLVIGDCEHQRYALREVVVCPHLGLSAVLLRRAVEGKISRDAKVMGRVPTYSLYVAFVHVSG